MTNTPLERAARAVQDEIERQVAEPGYLGWGVGQEDHRPPLAKTYVDGDLDVSALARAVLMAVREPDEATCEAGNDADYYSSEGCDINFLNMDRNGDKPATGIVFTAMIDAILGDGEGE